MNREYLAPQIRNTNSQFHSEAKLPLVICMIWLLLSQSHSVIQSFVQSRGVTVFASFGYLRNIFPPGEVQNTPFWLDMHANVPVTRHCFIYTLSIRICETVNFQVDSSYPRSISTYWFGCDGVLGNMEMRVAEFSSRLNEVRAHGGAQQPMGRTSLICSILMLISYLLLRWTWWIGQLIIPYNYLFPSWRDPLLHHLGNESIIHSVLNLKPTRWSYGTFFQWREITILRHPSV